MIELSKEAQELSEDDDWSPEALDAMSEPSETSRERLAKTEPYSLDFIKSVGGKGTAVDYSGPFSLQAATTQKTFPLISSTELTAQPPKLNWLVRNYLQVGEMCQMFGAPESCKSLAALDMAFCVSCGIQWHGNDVRQTDVVYIAGEGFVGLSKRIKGLEIKYGMQAPRLKISERAASLLESTDAQAVSMAIKEECDGAGMIFIDTLNRNFGGGDENSTTDMSTFISNIDQYLMQGYESVVIVHHSGHGNTHRGRGASSLFAALDVEYKVEKKGVNVVMSCTKAKDIQKPVPISFDIKPVELPKEWADEYGDIFTAPVLESVAYVENSASPTVSHKENMLLKGLRESTEIYGTDSTLSMQKKFGGLKGRKVVDLTYWRTATYPLIAVNSDTDDNKKLMAAKLASFNRIRDALLNKGKIATYDNQYWLIK